MIAYGNGCYEIIRECKGEIKGKRPERGNIKMQSKKSLLRLMFLMQATQLQFTSMITLTYPKIFPTDGRIVKRDVAAIVQKIRRKDYKYLWFLEFQKRGAPHVHILVDNKVITPRMRVDFGLYWTTQIALSDWFCKACPASMYDREVIKMAKVNTHPTVWQFLRTRDGARNYVTKYASKERQKTVPKQYFGVGRFWGSSRDLRPKGIQFDVTEDDIESWLVDNGHPAKDYHLVPRYLWGITPSGTSVA
jgi:hypothetical protein